MDMLTDQQWQIYQEQGYLSLGKLLSAADLKELQQRIDDIMMGTAPINYEKLMMQLDSSDGAYNNAGPQSFGHKGATLNYRKIQELEHDPIFLRYMQRAIFCDICARVHGLETAISSFRAMFMNKPANKGTFLPWHQDRWQHLDKDPLITVWTALDPATRKNGCVQIIPGSHHQLYNPEHGSGFLRDDQAEQLCPPEKAVFLEAEAGEVILLHNWLLHSSDKNNSNQSRRAFSVCYMPADTKVIKTDHTYPIVFGKGALDPDTVALEGAAAK